MPYTKTGLPAQIKSALQGTRYQDASITAANNARYDIKVSTDAFGEDVQYVGDTMEQELSNLLSDLPQTGGVRTTTPVLGDKVLTCRVYFPNYKPSTGGTANAPAGNAGKHTSIYNSVIKMYNLEVGNAVLDILEAAEKELQKDNQYNQLVKLFGADKAELMLKLYNQVSTGEVTGTVVNNTVASEVVEVMNKKGKGKQAAV